MQSVILAAGKSTRMKSNFSKLTFPLLGKRVLDYVIDALRFSDNRIICVTGSHNQDIELPEDVIKVLQPVPKGTGDAVKSALDVITDDTVMILPGDTPLITNDVLKQFTDMHISGKHSVSVLSTCLDNPCGYGRIVRNSEKQFVSIIEERDASDEIRKVNEINTGIYLVSSNLLFKLLGKLGQNNTQGEFYLTDIVALALSQGDKPAAFCMKGDFFLGVNTPVELSQAGRLLKIRKNSQVMSGGTIIIDPDSTFIDWNVTVGSGTVIFPGTVITGNCVIGSGCKIGPYTEIADSVIGNNCSARFSVIEESEVSDNCNIGPYAHLRTGTVLAQKVRIGNFVETKKAVLHYGVKANHLTYLGDTDIGEGSNIGAGTITCNYDGVNKFHTRIGKRVFIGSNASLVAPVEIGENAFIGAGSVITKDVPAYSLGLGRGKQVNFQDWAIKKGKAVRHE